MIMDCRKFVNLTALVGCCNLWMCILDAHSMKRRSVVAATIGRCNAASIHCVGEALRYGSAIQCVAGAHAGAQRYGARPVAAANVICGPNAVAARYLPPASPLPSVVALGA